MIFYYTPASATFRRMVGCIPKNQFGSSGEGYQYYEGWAGTNWVDFTYVNDTQVTVKSNTAGAVAIFIANSWYAANV